MEIMQFELLGLRMVLAPIVRFCLRHGLKLQDLVDAAKPLFVEHSQRALELQNEQISCSRVSLMTGVHRKDVTRLLNETQISPATPRNIIWKILNHWENSPEFQTKQGKPRTLSTRESNNEFAQLIACVSRELNPYSVLYEMGRIGVVRHSPRGIQLLRAEEIPISDSLDQSLHYLSTDIEDLISSVEANICEYPRGANHHLKTQFDEIPLQHVAAVRSWVNEIAAKVHKQIRKRLSAIENSSIDSNATLVRVAFLSAIRIDTNPGDPFHRE